MKVLAWVLTILSCFGAVALTGASGILGAVFLTSHVDSDRFAGLVIFAMALGWLLHPGLGFFWIWKDHTLWAVIYSALSILISLVLVGFVLVGAGAAAQP